MRKTAPAIILARPQMGENIGAAARAMANFGLSDLRIAAPRDGWPNEKADAMAAGGIQIVRAARVTRDVAEATGDLTLLFAATARPRELEKPALTPRQAMARARAEIAAGGRPGFLFGPEASGLSNEEVASAAAILAIPVDENCASLNLAQAVAVTAYEWLAGELAPEKFAQSAERASLAEIEGLTGQLEAALDAVGYFFPPHRAETMRLNLRAMFARGDFTPAEIRSLRGALKALTERPRKPRT
jgi:tRNA/rRNA methyltransferase